MAYNEILAERIRIALLKKKAKSVEKKMMGGLCFMVNDKMCVGVVKDSMMIRIDPEIYEDSLNKKGCREMDFTGRPLKGFLLVDSEGIMFDKDLERWVHLCLDFNPKAKSSKKNNTFLKLRNTKMSNVSLSIFTLFILFSIISLPLFALIKAENPEELIIAKERAALDRWKTGDTFGFVEIAADDITYFDPQLEKRVTGIKEFRDHYSSFNGTFSFPDYKLLNPQVQLYGDTGILTFNFVGYQKDGGENKWNATEVYHLINGDWKLASSHWSPTKHE